MTARDLHSSLVALECPKCGASPDPNAVCQLCDCGSPVLARYDVERARASLTKQALAARGPSIWRWSELLPVRDAANIVSLGEGITPVVALPTLGIAIGIERLSFKDEGLLPTGSFKARGAAVGVSRAKELGVKKFAMPTNGNAGGAWTAYGRHAGMDAIVVMPKAAPRVHRFECEAAGADVRFVDGLISDAGNVVAQLVANEGLYDASTLKEPYRVEGKKTMGFEIAEQFGWNGPDIILYPTGGGVGLIGIAKALDELQQLGWVGDPLPRMVAVQSTGCAPIVRAWKSRKRAADAWENAKTLAFGINVPKAIGDFLVLDALYRSDGCAIAVEDDEIVAAQVRAAREEGALLCAEGAATLAAAARLRESGWIRERERVLLINTGFALKTARLST